MRRPELLRRRPGRHVLVVAGLVLLQWAATSIYALRFAERDGWLFSPGADGTSAYASAVALSDGMLPAATAGYAWPLLLAPAAWVAGMDYLTALPLVVLFQVIVLQPVALLALVGIARRLVGDGLAYAAGAAWVLVPFAIVPLWDPRYHDRYVDEFLPQALGLTGGADYPSLVALLVAAYLVVRALGSHAPLDGALAGLAAGFAIGIKPSNGIFVAAPLLALAAARRWRAAGAFAVALLPALVTLAVWRYRGLGHLPAFEDAHLGVVPRLDRYVSLDWAHLGRNEAQLREYFWSVRLLEWLPLAGAIGLARRSVPSAVLFGSWLLAFVVLKGTSDHAAPEVATFFRLLIPAYPAFFALGLGLLLLIPVVGGRIASAPRVASRPLGLRAVAAGAVVAAAIPLVAVAAVRPVESSATAAGARAAVGGGTLRAQSLEEPREASPSRSTSCCSSSASRWARMTFWSASREITVE